MIDRCILETGTWFGDRRTPGGRWICLTDDRVGTMSDALGVLLGRGRCP